MLLGIPGLVLLTATLPPNSRGAEVELAGPKKFARISPVILGCSPLVLTVPRSAFCRTPPDD